MDEELKNKIESLISEVSEKLDSGEVNKLTLIHFVLETCKKYGMDYPKTSAAVAGFLGGMLGTLIK